MAYSNLDMLLKFQMKKKSKYTYNIQLRGVEEYVGMSYDEWLKNGGCYEKS